MADAKASFEVPVVDLDVYRANPLSAEGQEQCAKTADAFHKYGLLAVRDSRAAESDNDRFIDMLERYFEQPDDVVAVDVRKDLHYQVGTTPSFTELPRDHCDRMRAMKELDAPLSLCPPEKDPKMRYFWRIGKVPDDTKFPQVRAARFSRVASMCALKGHCHCDNPSSMPRPWFRRRFPSGLRRWTRGEARCCR
jgi:hypothetical protein